MKWWACRRIGMCQQRTSGPSSLTTFSSGWLARARAAPRCLESFETCVVVSGYRCMRLCVCACTYTCLQALLFYFYTLISMCSRTCDVPSMRQCVFVYYPLSVCVVYCAFACVFRMYYVLFMCVCLIYVLYVHMYVDTSVFLYGEAMLRQA